MRRKTKSKHSRVKTKLGLPDLEHARKSHVENGTGTFPMTSV
jgi:hypothetical protein